MSGEVYSIAKRAVNAYINTGMTDQYIATQVERDVLKWMEGKLREAKAAAWNDGRQAGWDDIQIEYSVNRNPYE